tara:strand:+ start:5538 stop:6287 length:750 start_codon:yes stop_codon:yes gene_type:complete
MNNNLLVFLNDGNKRIMSFPLDTAEESALSSYSDVYGEDKSNFKKYFYLKNDTVSPSVYKAHYELNENGELSMNMRNAFIEKAYAEIKKQRDNYLKSLDIPFMVSIENDDIELKNHVIKLKSFLRDLPDNLKFSEIESDVDILRYNPFSNIFGITILETGSGYTSPPEVTIDAPNGSHFGFAAKAKALIADGKVVKIEVTDFGCGYDFAPKVTIAAPENGEQAVASFPYPENSVLSQQDIVANTMSYYS